MLGSGCSPEHSLGTSHRSMDSEDGCSVSKSLLCVFPETRVSEHSAEQKPLCRVCCCEQEGDTAWCPGDSRRTTADEIAAGMEVGREGMLMP